MRRIVVLVAVLLLVGCGTNTVDMIDEHLATMKAHAETAGADKDGYINDLKEFSEFLQSVNNKKYEEFIEVQLEANDMRLKALENDDTDLITESSFKQAHALDILEQIRESQ